MLKQYQAAQNAVSKAASDLAHADRDWQHTRNTPRKQLFWVRRVKAQRQLIRAKRLELACFEAMIREQNKEEKKEHEKTV